MNKLTADKCREYVGWLNARWESEGLDDDEMNYLQALEIALPILEQQEKKKDVSLRDGLAALSAHIDSIGGYDFEALEAYRREEFGQQARGEGEWVELGEGAIPVHPDTLVEVKMRNGATDGPREAARFFWYRGNESRDEMGCDIIAYRIIPERATNQNGEQ